MSDAHHDSAIGSTTSTDRRDTVALVVGFLAVWAAILVAHRSPATGYETSIYTTTPLAFWVGIAVAVACALVVALTRPGYWHRLAAMLLAGVSFVAVVGLRLLRGYEFTSSGDALSHMGWIRNVLRGELALTDLIYPGPHTVAIYVHRLLGLDLDHAMQMTAVIFAALFVAFVPLAVHALTEARLAPVVGVLAAAMFLPINNISGHMSFFPSTLAVFLLPFVLLLTVTALRDGVASLLTPVDALVALGGVAILFVHPQQAVNLLLVLATISASVLLYRYRTADRSFSPLLRHTTFLAAVTVAWGVSHERISETAAAYTGTVASTLLAEGSSGAGAVAQRTGSLAAIGVSPVEIGAKLFLPSAVFLVLTALFLTGSFVRLVRGEAERVELTLVGLGLVPVGVVFLLYVLGDLQTIYFRHLGFIMALVTILGAVAVAHATESSVVGVNRVGAGTVSVALVVLLVISMATVFPSPFIYKPNGHVTEASFTGHAAAFDHEEDGVGYAGIRSGPDRFRDGLQGTYDLESRAERRSTSVPFGSLDGDLTTVFDGPRYLVVTRSDVYRETVIYRNIRYSDRGFETLDGEAGVDRVVTTGEFRLYRVDE